MDKKSLAMLEFVAANSPCPLAKLEKEFAMEYLTCPHYDRITRSKLAKADNPPNGDLILTLTLAGEDFWEHRQKQKTMLLEKRLWKLVLIGISLISLIEASIALAQSLGWIDIRR